METALPAGSASNIYRVESNGKRLVGGYSKGDNFMPEDSIPRRGSEAGNIGKPRTRNWCMTREEEGH